MAIIINDDDTDTNRKMIKISRIRLIELRVRIRVSFRISKRII